MGLHGINFLIECGNPKIERSERPRFIEIGDDILDSLKSTSLHKIHGYTIHYVVCMAFYSV